MRFREYLSDRRYPVLFWAAAVGAAEGVMLLFGSPGALQVFLLAIWTGAGAGILGYDYGRKREFYEELRERLGQLDEKYLVIEMLREPRFLEGRILYRSYVDILKSMNDEIERHERISSAFRSYVETWIHEIKIPIAGAKLILHNNPGESSRKLKEQLGKVEAYVEQVLYYIRSEVPQNDYSIGKYPLRELAESAVRENRDSLIDDCRAVMHVLGDCKAIDREMEAVRSEMEVTTGLIQKLIDENATRKMDQNDYRKRYDGYVSRYAALESRMDSLEKERKEREFKYDIFSGFLFELGEIHELPLAFDDRLFYQLVDFATVYSDGRVVFTFRNGTEITTEM